MWWRPDLEGWRSVGGRDNSALSGHGGSSKAAMHAASRRGAMKDGASLVGFLRFRYVFICV